MLGLPQARTALATAYHFLTPTLTSSDPGSTASPQAGISYPPLYFQVIPAYHRPVYFAKFWSCVSVCVSCMSLLLSSPTALLFVVISV